MTDYPKIDLPGQWRWKDSYFTNGSRKVKIQKKWGPFWFTIADELYWPAMEWTEALAISDARKTAMSYHAINKPTEIHPA